MRHRGLASARRARRGASVRAVTSSRGQIAALAEAPTDPGHTGRGRAFTTHKSPENILPSPKCKVCLYKCSRSEEERDSPEPKI